MDELDERASVMDAAQPKSLEEILNTINSAVDEVVDRIVC